MESLIKNSPPVGVKTEPEFFNVDFMCIKFIFNGYMEPLINKFIPGCCKIRA